MDIKPLWIIEKTASFINAQAHNFLQPFPRSRKKQDPRHERVTRQSLLTYKATAAVRLPETPSVKAFQWR
jgi:hypothetical protein